MSTRPKHPPSGLIICSWLIGHPGEGDHFRMKARHYAGVLPFFKFHGCTPPLDRDAPSCADTGANDAMLRCNATPLPACRCAMAPQRMKNAALLQLLNCRATDCGRLSSAVVGSSRLSDTGMG